MKKRLVVLISMALPLMTKLSYADNTPLGGLMNKVLIVLALFVLVGIVISQFIPMKNGYTGIKQRILFSIGGVAFGIISTMLFFKFVSL